MTGRRGRLKLCEPKNGEVVTTELIFIGKPGGVTKNGIRDHFEQALVYARHQGAAGYTVTDLRAFSVVFA